MTTQATTATKPKTSLSRLKRAKTDANLNEDNTNSLSLLVGRAVQAVLDPVACGQIEAGVRGRVGSGSKCRLVRSDDANARGNVSRLPRSRGSEDAMTTTTLAWRKHSPRDGA